MTLLFGSVWSLVDWPGQSLPQQFLPWSWSEQRCSQGSYVTAKCLIVSRCLSSLKVSFLSGEVLDPRYFAMSPSQPFTGSTMSFIRKSLTRQAVLVPYMQLIGYLTQSSILVYAKFSPPEVGLPFLENVWVTK